TSSSTKVSAASKSSMARSLAWFGVCEHGWLAITRVRSHAFVMRRDWRIRLLAAALSMSPALASAQFNVDGPLEEPTFDEEPEPGLDPVDADPRALTEFRPILDKYGYWVEDTRYGLVWVPAASYVGDDF